MQQKKLFLNMYDKAVERLPSVLYKDKLQRSVFTASELWGVLFDTDPTHSDLIQLAHALKLGGYRRHNNGRVIRIRPKQHGRYWIVSNADHDWSDAEVRADVKTHENVQRW